jgi:hypothetical protein
MLIQKIAYRNGHCDASQVVWVHQEPRSGDAHIGENKGVVMLMEDGIAGHPSSAPPLVTQTVDKQTIL